MKLTHIFLYPDLTEFRSLPAQAFRFQTRFICHFVQRHLAARRLQTEGFNRICFPCMSAPRETTYKNTSKALISEVRFDMNTYEQTALEDLPEYFIALLSAGIEKCSNDLPSLAEHFQDAIQSFRAVNYKNEWTFLSKSFRAAGLKCRLLCKLDISNFRLILEIERHAQLIFSQEILRTLPDELIYAYRFKGLVYECDTLAVLEKSGKPLITVPLTGL